MKVKVKIEGFDQISRAMQDMSGPEIKKIANAMTKAAASVVRKSAVQNIKRNPSIDSGALLKSVIMKQLPKGRTRLASEHIVTVRRGGSKMKKKDGTNVSKGVAPHAHLVEFGTVNMAPEPFMRPAFDANKEKAVEAMRVKGVQSIEAAVKRAKGSAGVK